MGLKLEGLDEDLGFFGVADIGKKLKILFEKIGWNQKQTDVDPTQWD